ncbi:MAG: SRPBCC family protein [Candidatus Obscuribacterales bacterium]|nr:SRPBCC family protein [Steroidobacteraceae bacterium]
MQLLADQTTDVACPVEVAYRYASNLEHFGEWFPGVIAIESTNALEHGTLGKEYLETVSVPLRGQRKVKIMVKEVQLNKLFVTESAFAPLMPRMEILFRASGVRVCQVTWRMFSRNNGFLTRATIIPVARSVMSKRAAIGVTRLKINLEGK